MCLPNLEPNPVQNRCSGTRRLMLHPVLELSSLEVSLGEGESPNLLNGLLSLGKEIGFSGGDLHQSHLLPGCPSPIHPSLCPFSPQERLPKHPLTTCPMALTFAHWRPVFQLWCWSESAGVPASATYSLDGAYVLYGMFAACSASTAVDWAEVKCNWAPLTLESHVSLMWSFDKYFLWEVCVHARAHAYGRMCTQEEGLYTAGDGPWLVGGSQLYPAAVPTGCVWHPLVMGSYGGLVKVSKHLFPYLSVALWLQLGFAGWKVGSH